MYEFEKRPSVSVILVTVICDKCGRRLTNSSPSRDEGVEVAASPERANEYFHLKTTWGYSSRRNGEIHEADVCEDCYDEIFKGVRIQLRNY